jgi:hypothetical protein
MRRSIIRSTNQAANEASIMSAEEEEQLAAKLFQMVISEVLSRSAFLELLVSLDDFKNWVAFLKPFKFRLRAQPFFRRYQELGHQKKLCGQKRCAKNHRAAAIARRESFKQIPRLLNISYPVLGWRKISNLSLDVSDQLLQPRILKHLTCSADWLNLGRAFAPSNDEIIFFMHFSVAGPHNWTLTFTMDDKFLVVCTCNLCTKV